MPPNRDSGKDVKVALADSDGSSFLRLARGSGLPATILALLIGLACGLSAHAAPASPRQIRNWTLLLRSDDPAKRSSAATALLATGEESALQVLMKALKPGQPEEVRVSVTTAFGVKGDDRAVPEIIAALEDESQPVRQAAAMALQFISTPRALSHIMKAAADRERSPQIRSQVIAVLGATLEIDVIPTLMALLADENGAISQAAWDALERITLRSFNSLQQLEKWWLRNEDLSREEMLAELVRLQNERIEAMRRMIETLYLRHLAERDKQDPVPLIDALAESDSTKVELYAIKELAPLRGEPAAEALLKALQDADALVRQAAAEALGVQGDPQAAEALGQALRDQAAEALVQALRDVDASVRAGAAKSLGILKAKLAVEALCKRLADSSPEVAAEAARALGEVGDPKAVESLVKTFRNPKVPLKVYEESVNALGKIKDPSSAPVFIELLGSTRKEDRWVAAESLGSLRVKEAVSDLSAMVRKKDETPQNREAALAALAKIGDPAALDTVVGALSDDEKRVSDLAFRSLRQLAKADTQLYSKALEALVAALQFDLAEKVLAEAAEQLNSASNPTGDIAALRSQVAKGLMAAQEWARARSLLEAAVNAVSNEPAYMKELATCLAALKDSDALLALLAEARRTFANEKGYWWQETLRAVQQISDSREAKRVIATVDALEKESADLGGEATAEKLRELRKQAQAQPGLVERPSPGAAALADPKEGRNAE